MNKKTNIKSKIDVTNFASIVYLVKNNIVPYLLITFFVLVLGIIYININPRYYVGSIKLYQEKELDRELYNLYFYSNNEILPNKNLLDSEVLFRNFLSNVTQSDYLIDILKKNENFNHIEDINELSSIVASNINVSFSKDYMIPDEIKKLTPLSLQLEISNNSKEVIDSLIKDIVSITNNKIKKRSYETFIDQIDKIKFKIKMKNDEKVRIYLRDIQREIILLDENKKLIVNEDGEQIDKPQDPVSFNIAITNDINKEDLMYILDTLKDKNLRAANLDYLENRLKIIQERDVEDFVDYSTYIDFNMDINAFLKKLDSSNLASDTSKIIRFNLQAISYETYNNPINIILVAFIIGNILSFIILITINFASIELKRFDEDNILK
jgi:hypothetical protein